MNGDDDLLAGLRRAAEDDRADRASAPSVLGADAEARIVERLKPLVRQGVPAPIPLHPRRTRRVVALGIGVVALAAAAMLTLRYRASDAPLPSYEVAVVGGEQTSRGASSTVATSSIKVRRGGEFRVVLRPVTRASFPVASRAFVAQDGRVRPFAGTVDVAEGGSVRVVATPGELALLSPGEARLVIFVGSVEFLPLTIDQPPSPHVSRFELHVDIELSSQRTASRPVELEDDLRYRHRARSALPCRGDHSRSSRSRSASIGRTRGTPPRSR